MKKILSTIAGLLLMGVLVVVTSCGDDDVDPRLAVGSEERPAWATPAGLYQTYEFTMSVQVTLQDELLAYASDNDLMCATIDGEIRAVAALQRTGGEVYFPLVIAGNSGSGAVSLSYYCAQLKRIYTLDRWQPFTPGMSPTQDGEPYVIPFITE
ncbi:MAG: hypothetical protein IJT19_06820 [Bacteroidaceae bacterium]|nr:hypothetical protein [Bacteroidaceae bacterium]